MPGVLVPGRAEVFHGSSFAEVGKMVNYEPPTGLLQECVHSTSSVEVSAAAELQAFMDWWCEADFAKFMSPERAAAALSVQRMLREGQGREGGAACTVSTSAGSEGSCSGRSSSRGSSGRNPPPKGPGVGHPFAGLLTAGDGEAFVARALQLLPDDWSLKTHRQQKRFLGSLRRSYYGKAGLGPEILGCRPFGSDDRICIGVAGS